MTGTSLDAVDIAFCEFDFDSETQKFKHSLINYVEYEIPNLLKKEILYAINQDIKIKHISQLNYAISKLYAVSVNTFIAENNINKNCINAIGMHGQTVWHEPNAEFFAGMNISSTLQLGNISSVAIQTGIRTIGDFRSADIALGGNGAPLVPIFDKHFLKSEQNIIALNIGGIANLTFIPNDSNNQNIMAFDTGPGNVWIDALLQKFFNKKYDKNGEIAKSGNVIYNLLEELLNKFDYIFKAPPKSTGRELFSESNLNAILENHKEINNRDIVCSITEFTAKSIALNIEKYTNDVAEIVVSGGGANNDYLLERIKYHTKLPINKVEKYGIDSSAKEAICFAFLAYLFDLGIDGNIPSVTGAKQSSVLGISSK